ncbi:MAG: penicillin-insensitive murein endopeptidase [Polyangiaceae bacterium]|nr:penicillin-insensitive murein endopeptidase [Polyangiaceae bacterium]
MFSSRFYRVFRPIAVALAAACLWAEPAMAAPPKADSVKGEKVSPSKADKAADKAVAKDAKANAKGDKDTAKAIAKVDKDAKANAKGDKDTAKAVKKAPKESAAKKYAKDDLPTVTFKGPASVGAPNRGKLQGAVKLHSSRSLKLRDRAHAWALPELVKLLQRAAGKIAKKHPRSVMLVGDLSQKFGGQLTGHNSHQSGRDADVGFYVANSKGRPAAMTRFVAFDGTGKSGSVGWAQFDDARNWLLVETLLTDKETKVRYIFVSNALRARLLAYALKKKVAKDLYAKAESALLSPRDADVHDDHFHVRIACPESMKGICLEESVGKSKPAVKAPNNDSPY